MFRKLQIALLSICMLAYSKGYGQHVIYMQNNSALEYDFQVVQTGNLSLNTSQYSILSSKLTSYADKMAMLEFEPDSILALGDTVDFSGILSSGGDSIILQMRLVGGNSDNNVFYSGAGNGFDHTWSNDSSFYSEPLTLLGGPFTFKYKIELDFSDSDDDAIFALQEDVVYSIDAADYSNPNVINVLSYNAQFTPAVSFNFDLRATNIPLQIDQYQDVVVLQEVFDDISRINTLTPAMLAAGFPYYTTILNDISLPNVNTPTGGGVIIYSRWPIDGEAEIKYANCSNVGAWDCLASKGVKYAKVNKLGKLYHIFGTHMEAGGSAADIQYRTEQYGEIANFMDTMNIPWDEAVLFCGDFNTDPLDGAEYDDIRNITNPIIPLQIGYYESTFSYQDTGKIIDHVWGQADHLHPFESNNRVLTFRSVADDMWNIFDLSDHRTVNGRFEYPNIKPNPVIDTNLCSGGSVALNVGNDPLIFQWKLNGADIVGATASSYAISNPDASIVGTYVCEVTNSNVYGGQGDVLSQLFFPTGPQTLEQMYSDTIANIGYQDPCGLGVEDVQASLHVSIVPMPNDGQFEVRIKSENFNQFVELYSPIGELISTNVAKGASVSYKITDLSAGVYVLHVVGISTSQTVKILVY